MRIKRFDGYHIQEFSQDLNFTDFADAKAKAKIESVKISG